MAEVAPVVTGARHALAEALEHVYDPIQDEPTVDFWIRSRRTNGHSVIGSALAVNGELREPESQCQRDWLAAVLEIAAAKLRRRPVKEESDPLLTNAVALMAKRTALDDYFVWTVGLMVKQRGLRETAAALGLQRGQVGGLLRSRRIDLAAHTEASLLATLKQLMPAPPEGLSWDPGTETWA